MRRNLVIISEHVWAVGFSVLYNRQLHPDEYAMAKKDAKIVAQQLGISEQEAEGRIVAEILRNSDRQTSEASGGVHDYEVRGIIGCQNLNCDGYKNDPQYANHEYNSQYIVGNQQAYDAGQSQLGQGHTYNELVTSNIKKDPVGATLAGAGMMGLGLATGGALASAGMMSIGTAVGLLANGGVQLAGDQPFDWTSFVLAGGTGAVSTGMKFVPVLLIGTGGALTGSALQGQNPNMSMAGAAAGTVTGYVIGGKVESAIGNRVNPWYRAEWVDIGNGVSKYVPPSAIPSIAGTTAGAISSESTSAGVNTVPNLLPKKQ